MGNSDGSWGNPMFSQVDGILVAAFIEEVIQEEVVFDGFHVFLHFGCRLIDVLIDLFVLDQRAQGPGAAVDFRILKRPLLIYLCAD